MTDFNLKKSTEIINKYVHVFQKIRSNRYALHAAMMWESQMAALAKGTIPTLWEEHILFYSQVFLPFRPLTRATCKVLESRTNTGWQEQIWHRYSRKVLSKCSLSVLTHWQNPSESAVSWLHQIKLTKRHLETDISEGTTKFGSGSNLSSQTRRVTRKYIPGHSTKIGLLPVFRNTVKYRVIAHNLMDLNSEL